MGKPWLSELQKWNLTHIISISLHFFSVNDRPGMMMKSWIPRNYGLESFGLCRPPKVDRPDVNPRCVRPPSEPYKHRFHYHLQPQLAAHPSSPPAVVEPEAPDVPNARTDDTDIPQPYDEGSTSEAASYPPDPHLHDYTTSTPDSSTCKYFCICMLFSYFPEILCIKVPHYVFLFLYMYVFRGEYLIHLLKLSQLFKCFFWNSIMLLNYELLCFFFHTSMTQLYINWKSCCGINNDVWVLEP